MVLSIANQNVAVGHDRNALQPFEFGIAGAPRAERPQKAAVRMENLDAIVAGIGHADEALIVDGHATGYENGV